MVWKVVNISDTGTASKFGADDTDKICRLFSGIDVDDVNINSDWTFRSGKFNLRNPANTFNYNFVPAAIVADRTVNLPLLTGTDTITMNDFAATLKNKTLDSSNTISSTSSLPSAVVTEDAANTFGDFDNSFQDNRVRIYNPAGTFRYTIVADAIAADRNLNLPLTTGTDTIAVTGLAQTLTNKTIDIKDNFIGLRQYTSILFKVGSTYYAIKYDGTVISSGTTAETVIQAALDQKGTVYFADAGVSSWALSGAFTGFTVDRGTRILCDSRASRVTIDVPQGFTGTAFRFIGSSGSLAETSGMDGITIVEGGTEQRDWTGIKIDIEGTDSMSYGNFRNIWIYDAAVGVELEVSNSRWIESCSFENITCNNCVIGFLFDAQTIGIQRNVFTKCNVIDGSSLTTNAFKDIDGRGNMFIGCDVWDVDTTASEANIKSTAEGTVIIGGMMTGDVGTFEDRGIGTLILDKNTKAGSGLNVITRPDVVKMGTWDGSGATSGVSGLLDGRLLEIVVGTAGSSPADDSTGIYRTYDTGATINSLNGQRWNTASMERSLGAYFKTALYLNSVSNVRIFAGFTSSASAPASAADPLNALSGVAWWFDSAVSANVKIMHNDGSGASTTVDTGVAAATSTLYPIEIYAVNDSRFRFVFNGVTTNVTTDMPASATDLSYWIYIENTTGASRTMRSYYTIIRSDK
jgi:hypothetical protein